MSSIEKSCYWMTTHPISVLPSLQGEMRTDIAIIGAGFTGLWTSLFLKQLDPSIDVAIVEKYFAGYGGSGRNGGILGETVDHSHQLAIQHFGCDEAKKLAELGKENINEMEQFFAAYQLDCDYEPTGRLFVALSKAQFEECRRAIESAKEVGVTTYQLLNAEQMQAQIKSPLYYGGIFSPEGGILNPIKLIFELRKIALQQGVQIFENSEVKNLNQGQIQTKNGILHSKKIILATDVYSHFLFPKLLHRFLPLYDYILVSESLVPSQLEWIGWKNRQGITDARTFFNYYRLTRDNRILWGTSEAKYYAPNSVNESHDHSEEHYKMLRESFAKHFPQLSELRCEYAWGGAIASTTRLTPFFGSFHNGQTLYALGYTGHGIGSSRIAAKILAHQALERSNPLLDISMVRNKPFPYPPEPARKIAVDLITKALRKTDQGAKPGLLLKILDWMGIGFSS
jgi:glycine/D-amino acid oxidase-like deaminating enzyme